jgi:DNA modification methylase
VSDLPVGPVHADCVEFLATLPADSVDAFVTDPPYGLEFMGRAWDRLVATGQSPRAMQDWHERWAREAFRTAKPGAYLLAFSGTRTVHRMATAIEDAGWEIRDLLVWGYASGFPKGLDVSKAIDAHLGAERRVTREEARPAVPGEAITFDQRSSGERERRDDPATPEAAAWVGWNTALKPAWEPIVMARKPVRGSVAANVLRYGTGAMNIDGTRIPMSDDDRDKFVRGAEAWVAMSERRTGGERKAADIYGEYGVSANPPHAEGRYPANVILTDPIFDGQYPAEVVGGGEANTGALRPYVVSVESEMYGGGIGRRNGTVRDVTRDADSGMYSRFFLISKASRADREPLLAGDLSPTALRTMNDGANGHDEAIRRLNSHPTVKPVALMAHLIRLVTPPGGVVCDPFLGSGTTGVAAEAEGFGWFGIERDADYIAIARTRLFGIDRGLGLDVPAPTPKPKAPNGHWPTARGPNGGILSGYTGQDGLVERSERQAGEPEALPDGFDQIGMFGDD